LWGEAGSIEEQLQQEKLWLGGMWWSSNLVAKFVPSMLKQHGTLLCRTTTTHLMKMKSQEYWWEVVHRVAFAVVSYIATEMTHLCKLPSLSLKTWPAADEITPTHFYKSQMPFNAVYARKPIWIRKTNKPSSQDQKMENQNSHGKKKKKKKKRAAGMGAPPNSWSSSNTATTRRGRSRQNQR
jgi:hypothetical protein